MIGSEELTSSKLGTKEYWDDFYSTELMNFKETEDEGEIWFGHTRMMKVVKWVVNNCKQDSCVIDIGAGNGVLLLELADEGFKDLYGIDYSANAVGLAQNIAASQNKHVNYQQADMLHRGTIKFSGDERTTFDVCHDKGTYDAISLREDASTARNTYIDTLCSIMHDTSHFVITSCNWRLEELKKHFQQRLEFVKDIPAPTFQFGGNSGSTVTTAVFRKKKT